MMHRKTALKFKIAGICLLGTVVFQQVAVHCVGFYYHNISELLSRLRNRKV
jgi:hypothetical protein